MFRESGWWVVAMCVATAGVVVWGTQYGKDKPVEVDVLHGEQVSDVAPDGGPVLAKKVNRIGPEASKVIRVLNDDTRQWSGGGDYLHMTEGEFGKDFKIAMTAGRNGTFWEPVHGVKLYVTVPAKGWPNGCPVHRDFSEADVRAVSEALDRRLKKLDEQNKVRQAADRRKALEGLK